MLSVRTIQSANLDKPVVSQIDDARQSKEGSAVNQHFRHPVRHVDHCADRDEPVNHKTRAGRDRWHHRKGELT
jgi:hypothetical protein